MRHDWLVALRYLHWLVPLLFLFFVAYAWPKRRTPMVQAFIAFLLAGLLYAAASTLKLSCETLECGRLWQRIEHVGFLFLSPFFLLLAIRYTGRDWRGRFAQLILYGIPAILLLIDLTAERHGWNLRTMLLVPRQEGEILVTIPGPLFYFAMTYLSLLTAYGFYLLADHAIRVPHSSLRIRTLFMIAGAVAPLGALVTSFGAPPPGTLDLAPFGMLAAAALYAVGLFRLGMIDLVPIARDRAFEALAEAIIVFDLRHRLIDYNPAAALLLPVLPKTPLGAPVSEALHRFPLLVEQVVEGLPGIEFDFDTPDGVRYLFARFAKIRNRFGQQTGGLLMLSDVTDREVLMQHLEEIAVYDTLTGLLNRRAFTDLLAHEVSRAVRHKRPLSLLMMDLDHFKEVNDSYGHQAGDRVLSAIGMACREAVRTHDIVARYGGEEIAVILPEAGLEAAAAIAERIRAQIAELAIDHGNAAIRITASFGVSNLEAVSPQTGDALVSAADAALYRAKAEGRDRVRSM